MEGPTPGIGWSVKLVSPGRIEPAFGLLRLILNRRRVLRVSRFLTLLLHLLLASIVFLGCRPAWHPIRGSQVLDQMDGTSRH